MKLSILAGSTSQSVNIFLRDSSSTTGAGLTGLAFNTASLTAYYTFAGANATATAITLATLAAVNSAFSSGGFKEIDATNMPGWYRFDVPNAALAGSKGRSVAIHFKGATNLAPTPFEVELTGWDNQNATSGGLADLDTTISSRMATYTQPTGFLGATFPAAVASTTNITLASGVSLAATQTFNNTGTWTGNISGSVGSVTGAVGSVTGSVGSVTGAVGSVTGNVGGNVVGSVGSVVGAVGSVTGNVGGNVTGSVGSVLGAVGSVTGNVGGSVGSVVARVTANVDQWHSQAVPTPNITGTPLVDVSYFGGVLQSGYDVGNAASNLNTKVDVFLSSRAAPGDQMDLISAPNATAVTAFANGLLDLASAIDAAPIDTVRETLRIILASAAGKLSGAATTTVVVRDTADTKNRITATVDANGNRSAVTYNGA